MSNKLPYDDQLKKRLEEIPLPPENDAWEDMKYRLEESDKNRPFIPPLPKGCGWYGLLLLPVLLAVLFIISPIKRFRHQEKNSDTSNKPAVLNGNLSSASSNVTRVNTPAQDGGELVKNDSGQHQNTTSITNILEKKYWPVREKTNTKPTSATNILGNNKSSGKKKWQLTFHIRQKQNTDIKAPGSDSLGDSNPEKTGSKWDVGTVNDSLTVITVKPKLPEIKPDSPPKNITDTLGKVMDSHKKKDSTSGKQNNEAKKHDYYFGAGLALHQLLPVAGQKSNPYNSLGRKSFWGDYIPSVYLRLYRDQKWFFQSEFRYGAPQYTKDVVYIPKKIIDSAGTTTTYSSSRLKKTFYNEIPLSINYFILPGFSAGAGVTINTFKSALVQRDVRRSNSANQSDSLVNTSLVSQSRADSNFAKTYMQALIEAQYQWHRFSIGARYSFGLDPYLRFTLPAGEQREEKNSSLQLVIRFEIRGNKRNTK